MSCSPHVFTNSELFQLEVQMFVYLLIVLVKQYVKVKNRDWEFVKTCGEQLSSIFLIWLIGLFIYCRSFSKQFFADFLPVLFVYAINLLIISTENPQDKTLRIRCGLKLLRLIFFWVSTTKSFPLVGKSENKATTKVRF